MSSHAGPPLARGATGTRINPSSSLPKEWVAEFQAEAAKYSNPTAAGGGNGQHSLPGPSGNGAAQSHSHGGAPPTSNGTSHEHCAPALSHSGGDVAAASAAAELDGREVDEEEASCSEPHLNGYSSHSAGRGALVGPAAAAAAAAQIARDQQKAARCAAAAGYAPAGPAAAYGRTLHASGPVGLRSESVGH